MDTSVRDYYPPAAVFSPLDIQVLHAGEQNCPPGHCFGYATRTHYLIHHVVSGCGEYRVNRKTYRLHKGDGFLILPGVSTLYKASDTDPWTYRWVGFSGKAAKRLLSDVGLDEKRPVYHYDADDFLDKCLVHLRQSCQTTAANDVSRTGYLLLLLGKLQGQHMLEEASAQEGDRDHFDEAAKFIRANHMRNIKVTDIAAHVGVDRSQLYRIFEKTVHMSPKQYLNRYRLDCAGILIHTSDMTFNEVASAVGFEYSSHFFRLFKQHFGATPSEYKNNKS